MVGTEPLALGGRLAQIILDIIHIIIIVVVVVAVVKNEGEYGMYAFGARSGDRFWRVEQRRSGVRVRACFFRVQTQCVDIASVISVVRVVDERACLVAVAQRVAGKVGAVRVQVLHQNAPNRVYVAHERQDDANRAQRDLDRHLVGGQLDARHTLRILQVAEVNNGHLAMHLRYVLRYACHWRRRRLHVEHFCFFAAAVLLCSCAYSCPSLAVLCAVCN